MFNKAAIFGDLHLGHGSDNETFNHDCMDYIDWFIVQCKKFKIDHIIFLGDWFDNRNRLQLDTIHYSNLCLDKLRKVAPITMLVGNHDMFYKNTRDIHSLSQYAQWDNVTVIDSITQRDGVTLCPYLVGNEHLMMKSLEQTKYTFGHFEIPNFLVNRNYVLEAKEGVTIDAKSFNTEFVFSGHFHKRQLKIVNDTNIWYVGSPFGHDFNNVNEFDHGMTILEWGAEPTHIDYEGPIYRRYPYNELSDHVYCDKTILEVTNIDHEDVDSVKKEYDYVRELRFKVNRKETLNIDETIIDLENKTIDDVVIGELKKIDPRGSNIIPDVLVDLYKG